MKKVGILSENIYEMCYPDEMLKMFENISVLIKKNTFKHDYLITDRLYKKYLTIEMVDETINILNSMRMMINANSLLNWIKNTLIESKSFYSQFHDYVPIKIGITEIPASFDDEFRDLSEYDNLQGPPFWLREYLQEYPDTVLPFE